MATDPLERKLSYVDDLASVAGINLSMLKLASLLDLTYLAISFNLLFRLYLDIFLNLNLHLDFNFFDFWKFDFSKMFKIKVPKVEKARYDISRYEMCYYDPEQITPTPLERLSWYLRKKITETSHPYYKTTSKALKSYIETYKDILKNKEVNPKFLDALEEMLSFAEGKTLNCSYVGFSIVGLSKVMETPSSLETIFIKRNISNWKTEDTLKSVAMYENHVGYARVGYARVSSPDFKPTEEFANIFKNAVDDFHKRVGFIKQYDQKVLHQRVFMLQRVDKYHWEGGKHQISMQNLINTVKKILDEEGIVAQFRMAYLNFAHELYYLKYESHRLYKRYKTILTVDDLINKYLNIGLNINILDKIKRVIVHE